MAISSDDDALSNVELSDSTNMPEGSEAPSLGGSASSAEELSPLSPDTTPCERGGDNCACCKKRKFDNEWTCDLIEGCKDEILAAVADLYNDLELYKPVEHIERCCKKSKDDLLERMAKMNEEQEERIQKWMVEQQVVMAKIIADAVKDTVKDALDSPAE